MYCSNCGKEHAESDLFCSECGNALQTEMYNHILVEEDIRNKTKMNRAILIGILVVVIILSVVTMCGGQENFEFSSNSGDKLPIVVNQISYQESFWTGYIDITFEIENLTQNDYKEASIAILAWDSEGYPIKICGMYEFDPDYVSYIGLENIRPREVKEATYNFETEDIAYMSVFLSHYTDFHNNEWENPIIKEVEEDQGQKLDETELYYFIFHK